MISAPGLLVALCCVFSLVENEVDAAITVDSFRTYKAPGTALTWTWTTLQPNGEFRFDVDNLYVTIWSGLDFFESICYYNAESIRCLLLL